MSSSTTLAGDAQWQTTMAQPSFQAASSGSEDEGVTIKAMRLKVLYTFDDENKTNCLARWPHVLQVRTVTMDETTVIGVIELKTCIQAIVQCSPELVAKLGHDYTVYAYDFSEYDLPLVGQGMLSWALAASSPAPDCPASESQKLITGRVCKNIQGLFSNGVKETLEVKLRLVPVPTLLQSEYLSSMEKYREVSRYMPASIDQNEWLSLLRLNPGLGQPQNRSASYTPAVGNPRDGASHEVMNQLLSPSLLQHTSADPFNNPAGNQILLNDSQLAASEARKAGGKTSRPSSRASVKRPRKARVKSVAGGDTSGYEEGTDGEEPPPGRKRAKIVSADWDGKSSFGAGSDSLRVAASTTNSIRQFRPIAIAPKASASTPNHLLDIPRAPTPVPGLPGLSGPRGKSQPNLRRDSMMSQTRYQSPYSHDDRNSMPNEVRLSIESAMTSPEKNDSSGETPPDIASSPPVLRGQSTRNSSPNAPSSPVLPQMPRPDSGFMSGDMDELHDLFGDDDEMRPINEEDIAIASMYSRRSNKQVQARTRSPRPRHQGFAIQEETPGPPELLPTKMAIFEQPSKASRKPSKRTASRANSVMSDDMPNLPTPIMDIQPSPLQQEFTTPLCVDKNFNAMGSQHTTGELAPLSAMPAPTPSSNAVRNEQNTTHKPRLLSRTASVGSLTFPMVAASDPAPPLPPTSLSRSQTWSEAPHPLTDAAPVPDNARSRDAVNKKALIRQRLEDAVSRGEMPPFCQNCGALETPAWRKCFAREVQGVPGYHEYSDEPGRVIAIHVLTKDEAGQPTSYKLFKKALGPDDSRDEFAEQLLCNPCGIWLSKFKQLRPEDKWNKKSEKRGKRDRPVKAKGPGGSLPMATSEAYFQSDAPGPAEQAQQDTPIAYMDGGSARPTQTAAKPQAQLNSDFQAYESVNVRAQRQRASSQRPAEKPKVMTSGAATAALRRAIQSSPARYLGTHISPIDIEEEDMGTTRRTLFPSPRKDSSPKVLGELATNIILPVLHHTPSRVKPVVEVANKENQRPVLEFNENDPLDRILEEALESGMLERPKTPSPKTPKKIVFKTPTRPTPSHRPITRSQSKSARSYRHETLPQRTPSKTPSTGRRRSPRHNDVYETPFTASLNRLLSEANNHSPSRHLDLGLEFSLPDLGHSTNGHSDFLNLPGFDNQDFFSTDVPMPSSPPRFLGMHYEGMDMNMEGLGGLSNLNSDIWNDFQLDMGSGHGNELGGLLVDENGRATFEIPGMTEEGVSNVIVVKKEPVEEVLLEPTKGSA